MDLLILLGMLVTLYLLSVAFDPKMRMPTSNKIISFLYMVLILDVWIVGLVMTCTTWLAISTAGFFLGMSTAVLPISIILLIILKIAYRN